MMTNDPKTNKPLAGRGISPGLAKGEAFVFREPLESDDVLYEIQHTDIEREREKVQRAFETVLRDLAAAVKRVERDMDAKLADIFRAHDSMLRDPLLLKKVHTEVESELVNVEEAVKRVFRRIERKFGEAAEQRIQQRSEDVRDLGRPILRALAGVVSHPLEKIPRDSILVAKHLLPSDTVHLSRQSAAGVVVESAGAGSHAALLTRELGIPMVAQIAGVLDEIENGDTVLVDGLRGAVVVSPDEDTGKEFALRIDSYHSDVAKAKAVCREPATTSDGVSVTVMANVGDLEDVEFAAENGADGIGLYRVDQIYLSRNEPPSEEELYEAILKSLDPLPDKPVTIRLLDVGGDKRLSYMSHRHEENPFLGRRGVRLLLDYPELTAAQLKVCLRLSRNREIRVLVPMITLAEEMGKIKGMYLQAAKEAGIESLAPLGAMLETPAAALSVKEIAQHADFFSIGTNDLTQYTLAAGRENPRVADYFIETHPVIMRLLEIIVTDAGDTPLEICGELAGYPDAIPSLVQRGIRALSVAPPLVPFVKQAVRRAHAVTSPAASSSNSSDRRQAAH